MALDFLHLGDCTFYGPALPEPYVRFELEKALAKHKLLPDTEGLASQAMRDQWEILRRKLRDVSPNSGPVAITNRVLDPLVSRLGYAKLAPTDDILTREGEEAGGALMVADAGAKLRCWAIDYDADLDAPTQRGHAYRFSPIRIAQRVLLATGERVGLITNGVELRLLLCDPARPDSHVEIDLNVWRLSRDLPAGYQLLLALASPAGVAALSEIIEDARLKQNKVTKELRVQARRAVEEFVQSVLDQPENGAAFAAQTDKEALAKQLWHEGLVVVYRLLFILKCESTSDPSRVFRFASTPLWRDTYSPSTALARIVRRVLDEGVVSGRYLEDGIRVLFRLFSEGLDHPGLTVRPLGGALFGGASTPLLSDLRWGEPAVAHLLDRLLWSDTRRGRERVHYGPLDVEDLGRVYEALLELEPGIAVEPMCRLQRQKMQVVVPAAQGEKYKIAAPTVNSTADVDEDDAGEDLEESEETPARGKKTKVEWIETIEPGLFYLRVGLGRKSSGSYYTPHSFVRFLVQETLGPQCDDRAPRDNPDPGAILKLKVLDPACGSGHFLVEACRFLAGRVYEAARLCDELATKAEYDADAEKNESRKQALVDRAAELRRRLKDLPDAEDELLSYLPSRSAGAEKAGLSAHDIARAEAICRRLVAVHCIYGADVNPLAVELAKLSLWIESHAEGFPLTFLDHRIVLGNSLTGPFWEKLITYPCRRGDNDQPLPVKGLFAQGLDLQVTKKLGEALMLVRELEASVGVNVKDIDRKAELKRELDSRLLPFRILAAAWSGGVMLGTDQPEGQPRCDDFAYEQLLRHVGENGELPATIKNADLRAMIAKGLGLEADETQTFDPMSIPADARPALPFDLTFPEVFHPTGQPHGRHGFDAIVGNPPWEGIDTSNKEFFAAFDFSIFELRTEADIANLIEALMRRPEVKRLRDSYESEVSALKNCFAALFEYVNRTVSGQSAATPDMYQCFAERAVRCLHRTGRVGLLLPAAFHSTESATGLRQLYLDQLSLVCCFSFENRNALFDIHRSKKFAAIVADARGPSERFRCAFYLHDDKWLFAADKGLSLLSYTPQFIAETTGEQRNFLELRSTDTVPIAHTMYRSRAAFFGEMRTSFHVLPTEELHTSKQRHRTLPLADIAAWADGQDPRLPGVLSRLIDQAVLPVCKGEHFHQFDSTWGEPPEVGTTVERMAGKEARLKAASYFRLVFRRQASSTNERTVISHITQPGLLYFDSALPERDPFDRATWQALATVALCNSFAFDWLVRQLVAENITFNYLDAVPVPAVGAIGAFLAHGVLRLCAQHAGYEPLWREQLSSAWREPDRESFTWPVLAGDDERWAVRALIDAVLADAYSLSREQYAYVLSTFSHASYERAPELCLAAFDELKAIGLASFCEKHDPYHTISLVETLPVPVTDLSLPAETAEEELPDLWQEEIEQPAVAAPRALFDGIVDGVTVDIAVPRPVRKDASAGTTDRHVAVLARIIHYHQDAKYLPSLGETKAEKISHIVESHLKFDLGRQPMRDAAGPDDYPHLKKVQKRAKAKFAFETRKRDGEVGWEFITLNGFNKSVRTSVQTLGTQLTEVDKIIQLFLPLDTYRSEAVATLYAVWHDLLADGALPSDDQIIKGFYDWSAEKKRFKREELVATLTWMRKHSLVPDGKGKKTGIRAVTKSKTRTTRKP